MPLSHVADDLASTTTQPRLGRRSFVRNAGMFGLSAAAAGVALGNNRSALAEGAVSIERRQQALDTVRQIFTAALIAEDLATTFYYYGLTGPVIQDPALAGPGGNVFRITPAGDFGNVDYLRAAITEEIDHANLFRSLLGISGPAADPVQTFYFPSGAFDTLPAFTGLLDALENAFIGAYLNAIQEFGTRASQAGSNGIYTDLDGTTYTAASLVYFAKVAASILGIESEHRVLGRVISNSNPANNRAYESTDRINAVYNGPASAVAALTPFLTASTGPAKSFAYALANNNFGRGVLGGPPSI